MAAHDPSWDAFRAALKHWMDLRQMTNRELAAALNQHLDAAGLSAPIDEQIIKRWRHSTAPPLSSLKVIARTLQMSDDPEGRSPYDPTYLPRTMSVLDPAPAKDELIESAYRLQSIRTQIADAQATLAAATADEGVMNIVRAAVHADLGCAVLPVHEGPPGYPMHVCDRIDIRSIDHTQPVETDEYAQLSDALHDAFAVRSRRTPRFCVGGEQSVAQWAVPYIGRPRVRGLHGSHPQLSAVAITSVTTAGWIDDIGDIVAMVLGYGFATTRELARELVTNPYAHSELRSTIHDSFLHEATPQRRVWTHYTEANQGLHDAAPFRDREGRVHPDLLQFFVLEDDDLLRHAARQPAGSTVLLPPEQAETVTDAVTRTRDALLARARSMESSQRLVVVPTTFHETPEARWQQVFQCVLEILQAIAARGIEVNAHDFHERLVRTEPGVAPQVLRWLADHDAPFVSPAFRTAH